MLTFESDYTEGAHEKILEKLIQTNLEQLSGYGEDTYSCSAKEKIREAIGLPGAQITFLVGGTQTNQIVIDSLLQPYEGVVSAVSGHISVHEAGAIEAVGHKVIPLPEHDGKMKAEELLLLLRGFYDDLNRDHMVFPGMVYLSYPTEYGTLYTKEELTEIAGICREFHIPLYVDGARLGYGLASDSCDLTLKEFASIPDVFYIGGTKVGALLGEAVVFTRNNEPAHFVTRVKRRGGLLAKGRVTGIQFDALFTDDLYMKISRHAIDMALLLRKGLLDAGYTLYIDSPTNQQFVVLPNREMEELKQHVGFSFWESLGQDRTVVRFATSWATKEEDVRKLLQLLAKAEK